MESPARRARLDRARAARAKQALTWRRGGGWKSPCLRCGQPGPAKTFGVDKKIRICNTCWKTLPKSEREEIRGTFTTRPT